MSDLQGNATATINGSRRLKSCACVPDRYEWQDQETEHRLAGVGQAVVIRKVPPSHHEQLG